MKTNNSRLIFLDRPFNFKCKKFSKLSFPGKHPLYCSSDFATEVFFGPLTAAETLKQDLVRLKQELDRLEEAEYLEVKEYFKEYHTQWIQKDKAAIRIFTELYLVNPLLNLRSIIEKRRIYLDLFRTYSRFRYPIIKVFGFLKEEQTCNYSVVKRRFEYSAQQLKLRHAYILRVDRFFQSLFQCLREIRDAAILETLYTTFAQKLLNCYFQIYLIKTLIPYSGILLVQGILIIFNLFPLVLKEIFIELAKILLVFFPKFVLIGIIIVFIVYVYGMRTQSPASVFACALSFWVKFFFLFLGCYLISRHPIAFIIMKFLVFTFKSSIVSDQL